MTLDSVLESGVARRLVTWRNEDDSYGASLSDNGVVFWSDNFKTMGEMYARLTSITRDEDAAQIKSERRKYVIEWRRPEYGRPKIMRLEM